MTTSAIEEYILNLEHQLVLQSAKMKIEISPQWVQQFPSEAGVYVIREEGEICYVGETGNLKGRMGDLLRRVNHSFRRSFGNHHFSEDEGYAKATSSKKFPEAFESLINERFIQRLTVSAVPVALGRKELEERIFDKYCPVYNIKGQRGSKKAYSKSEKQKAHPKAYEPWTPADDEKLEQLYCEGSTIAELSNFFHRNAGAIRSRIKKLELPEKYGKEN